MSKWNLQEAGTGSRTHRAKEDLRVIEEEMRLLSVVGWWKMDHMSRVSVGQ